MKKICIWVMILVIACVFLAMIIADMLNINKIKREESNIEVIGEKQLILKEWKENVHIPHLNIKGIIKEVNKDTVVISLSENSASFLESKEIVIKNKDINLNKNEKIFIVLNGIQIDGNICKYSSVELYKLKENFCLENTKKAFFVCKNDYGGFMKVNGKLFKYKNNIYFLADIDLGENNEIFYENVNNGNLLIEEYKSLVFPFKVYNMINPQETMYEEIVEIYNSK